MISGVVPYSGTNYYSGDLALSFNDGVTLGDHSTYEYAVDFGLYTADYSGNSVGMDNAAEGEDTAGLYDVTNWNTNIYYTDSNPFAMEIGTVVSGYEYKGGNPALESNWTKVK